MSLRASIARLLATNVGLLLVALAVIPLLTRVVSPADWGHYQLLVNLAVVAASVLFLKMDAAYVVVLPRQARRLIAASVLPVALATSLLFAVVVTGLVLWREEYGSWALLAVPAALGLAFYQMTQVMQAADEDFAAYSRTKIQVQLGQNALLLAAAFLYPDFVVLFLAWCLPLLPLSWRYVRDRQVRDAWRKASLVLRRQRDYVLYNAPSVLLNNLRMVIPLMMLFAVADPHQYGLFMMAVRLMDIPVSVVGSALQNVLAPRLSVLWKEDREAAAGLFFKSMLRLQLVAVAGGMVLALIPDSLLVAVLGPQWGGLKGYLLLVAGWKLLEFVNVPLAPVSNLLARQRAVALQRVFFLALTVGLMLWLGDNTKNGVLVIIGCSAAYYLTYTFLNGLQMWQAGKQK
ncbi:MAG: hypothetical protein K0S46_1490 [Moraxellaceae bacterium]|jgi:O-antigen/teichoic acid export membrane protein|nr:hypothetical protein [Moraxellaceae bacterium]